MWVFYSSHSNFLARETTLTSLSCDDVQFFHNLLVTNAAARVNAAARLVCNIPKYDHITPALIRLHWLPVQFRIEFKVAMLVYKCINGTAPQYLKDLTKNREISRYSLRSNKGILLVDNSAKAKKTLGDRAFVNAAPRVWNRLPLDIRLAISYDNFKSMLKTHFF